VEEDPHSRDWDLGDFKKIFPALYRETMSSKSSVRISAIRSDPEVAEREAAGSLRGFVPGAVDYLRRCSSDEEALEVIEYLEERGEISREYSEQLKKQVREMGVRSFGKLKEDGYYLRKLGSR